MASLLLVEDESSLRELVAEVLGTYGYETTPAEDAAVALKALEHHAFDVLITDVNLPGAVSGIELAGLVHQRSPTTMIIMVSGNTRAQLPRLPEHVVFLAKPYRVQQLLDIVEAG